MTSKVKISTTETYLFTYNHDNQLTKVEHKATSGGSVDQRVEYTYDVFGQRIKKSVDSDGDGSLAAAFEKFSYDLLSNAWADLDNTGSLTTRRIYLGLDALAARIGSSGNEDWYLTDSLGSVRDIVNSSGTLIDHIDYSAFGTRTQTQSSNGDRYGFTGREHELWDGMYYRGRYTSDGRFIQEDPSGFTAGDPNLRRYVGNNPTNSTDPSGLQAMGQAGVPQSPLERIDLKMQILAGFLLNQRIQPGSHADYSASLLAGFHRELMERNPDLRRIEALLDEALLPFQRAGVNPFQGPAERQMPQPAPAGEAMPADAPAAQRAQPNRVAQFLNGIANWLYNEFASPDTNPNSIGAPGFWDGLIPVLGSGRRAINHFQNGRILAGVVNSGLAVADVFLVRAIYNGAVTLGGRLLGGAPIRSFTSSAALRRALGPAGPNREWHHIVEQRAVNIQQFGAGAIHITPATMNLTQFRQHNG